MGINVTNSQEPRKPSKSRWHSKSWWTMIGAIATILSVVVTILIFQFQKNSSSIDSSGGLDTTRSSPSSPSNSTITSSTTSSDPDGNEERSPSDSMFLSDIEEDEFIREPPSVKRGAASIASDDFPSSYYYRFTNCSACEYETELNISDAYSGFTGVFGLTDESRHDDEIDGVVYFSIQSESGDQLWAPTKIEYPEKVPFEVDLTGVNRIRLIVNEGTNAEYACWCDARLIR